MANGWWNLDGAINSCVAAYQPIGAASYAASKVNLFNPGTYDATDGNAPTFDASYGWSFDGTDDYLDTGIVGYKSGSWIIRYSDAIVQGTAAFGIVDTNFEFNFYPKYTDNNQYFRMGQNYQRAAPADFASGVAAASSSAAYWNGDKLGNITGTYAGTTARTIHLGHVNGQPTTNATYFTQIKKQAIAFYSGVLSDAQMASLTTAMNALPVTSGIPKHFMFYQRMRSR